MGTGYVRNDTANNIADGNIINASDLDGEYDAIQSAFDASTGHTHDGTAGEGAPIETIGPSQDVVATASVLRPKTDNTVDLGTTSLEYKDLFLDGTAHIDTLDVDENASITGTLGVTGATTLSSTLGVTGAATLSSTLGVTGATTLSSTLGVTGAATLSSTLAVTGATGIDGDFDINTNKFTVASATGNTAVAGTLGVTGATTATGGLNVDTISEITSANGVVIDGVTLKDGGATVTADVSFGDGDKAIFGAGGDLQIYHDTHSYIHDTGDGNLLLLTQGAEITLLGNTSSEYMGRFIQDGAVELYHNGNLKLATTNTGVDITGTLTSDGLTVDGGVSIQNDAASFSISNAAVDRYQRFRRNASNSLILDKYNGSTTTNTAKFDENGDISFYEDTGTTAKFFWDASAESLSLGSGGTANPAAGLIVTDSASSGFKAKLTSSAFNSDGNWLGLGMGFNNNYMKSAIIAEAKDGNARTNLHFALDSNVGSGNVDLSDAKMTITYDGNVGIGTTSPSDNLHIYASSGGATIKIESNLANAYDSSKLELLGGNLSTSEILLGDASVADVGKIIYRHDGNSLAFNVASAERMRIDSSGNLLVGKPSADNTTVGTTIYTSSGFSSVRSGGVVGILNRLTSDGDIMEFRKDGATVGSIGTIGGDPYFAGTTKAIRIGSGGVYPTSNSGSLSDGTYDLGAGSVRFKDLYLSGTIEIENGTGNVGVGKGALSSNTGSNNTAVGHDAGLSNTTSSFSTYVGYVAGENTTGEKNTFLGQGAGSSVTTGADNTIIGRYNGNQGGLDIRTSSNNIVLADGDGNPRALFTSAGGMIVGDGAGFVNNTTAILCDGGIYIGAYDGDKRITDASQGGGSDTLYIGNAAIQVSSDQRIKTNIVDTTMSAVDKINEVRVVDFEWDDPSDTSYNNRNARGQWTGIIAQELVNVFPFAVNAPRNEDDLSIDQESDKKWQVDMAHLVPVLMKAIQEQQATITALETRVTALENA